MNEFPDITILVGSGRSGTSFLQMLLFHNLDIGFPSEEPKFVVPLYHRFHREGVLSPQTLRRVVQHIHESPFFQLVRRLQGMETSPDEILERLREPTYRGVVYATLQYIADKRGKTELGYKDPGDVANIDLLAELLPTSRFVHITRDGRDVALSLLQRDWGPTNLFTACRYWARVTKKGQQDGAALPGRYFELRLEDLALDPERSAPGLLRFVTRDNYSTAQLEAVIAEIKSKGSKAYGWKAKLADKERYVCEAAAGSMLRVCGYETEFTEPNISPIATAYYLGTDFVSRSASWVRSRLQVRASTIGET